MGFVTFGALWVVSTWLGVFAVRQGVLALHRRLMFVSVAMAYSAVTFRIGLVLLVSFGLGESAAHDVMAWACWIPNVVFVECMSRRRSRSAHLDRATAYVSQTAG